FALDQFGPGILQLLRNSDDPAGEKVGARGTSCRTTAWIGKIVSPSKAVRRSPPPPLPAVARPQVEGCATTNPGGTRSFAVARPWSDKKRAGIDRFPSRRTVAWRFLFCKSTSCRKSCHQFHRAFVQNVFVVIVSIHGPIYRCAIASISAS